MKNRLRRAKTRLARAFNQLLYVVYYKFVFGRDVPFARQLSTVGTWERLRGRGDSPLAKEVWERRYQSGDWAVLATLEQVPRYSVIIGYLHHLKPHAAILDVGCGEGLLFHRYRPYGYARYVGLDLSATALANLMAAQDEVTRFVCADAEAYVPTEKFDVIVFNEALYYFREPLAVVERYVEFLDADGIVIVSTFAPSMRAQSILQALKRRYPLVDETKITRGAKAWICTVVGPGRKS